MNTPTIAAQSSRKVILFSESASQVAVNVDLADDPAIDPDRNNNFRLRLEQSCKIARIGCDIVHNDRVALCNGCTAYPLSDRNPHVLYWSAAIRTKYKDAGILPVHPLSDPFCPLHHDCSA